MAKTLIQLVGKARHGKDTVADFLVENYGFVKMSYAAALKKGVAAIFGLGDNPDWEKLKTTIVPGFSFTYGKALQIFGTEGGRTLDENLWTNIVYNSDEFRYNNNIVITDGRFKSEIVAATGHNAYIWYVVRPEFEVSGRDTKHASEDLSFMEDVHVDKMFLNDGTYEEFLTAIRVQTKGLGYLTKPAASVNIILKAYSDLAAEENRAKTDADFRFDIGEKVCKIGGSYEATGTIVGRFWTRNREERYVMDFDVPPGLLHIFSANNLETREI